MLFTVVTASPLYLFISAWGIFSISRVYVQNFAKSHDIVWCSTLMIMLGSIIGMMFNILRVVNQAN